MKNRYDQDTYIDFCAKIAEKHKNSRVSVDIPDWDTYFLNLAYLVASRSKDSQTQCGCILVDQNNHIVGTGYNSFIPNMPDMIMPNTRPEKYKWMLHAEEAALANLTVVAKSHNIKAYITAKPCFSCLQKLATHNIKTIIHGPQAVAMLEDQDEQDYNFVLVSQNIQMTELTIDNQLLLATANKI